MKENIDYICKYFYLSYNIPIRYYSTSILELRYPNIDDSIDPIIKHINKLITSTSSFSYITTETFLLFGMVKVNNTNDCLLIGPLSSIRLNENANKAIMKECEISPNNFSDLCIFLNAIPILTPLRFTYILNYLNYIVNNETLVLPEINTNETVANVPTNISTIHTNNIFNSKEFETFHTTYEFEKLMLTYVENGDIYNLKSLLTYPKDFGVGKIADTDLRQFKNLFITTVTLLTRASIKGGLDIETAYELSDVYIQQMERLYNADTIQLLQQQMIFDFCKRVESCKVPPGVSKIISNCINFINLNTNKPISVNDVSNHIGLSRTYISTKFKLETGLTLNEFITNKKIEESKTLLKFSAKSLSEISEYLCFSSQSYFQNVFKKITGITPKEYRDSCR